MTYDLKSMRLLARGGQADIYAMDGGRVLRVLRPGGGDAEMLHSEHEVMALLKSRGADVPEVYEEGDADGRPAFAMQRVDGPSLMDRLTKNPLAAGSAARELARLHCGFLKVEAPAGLIDVKARAGYLIGQPSKLDDEDREFVRSLLTQLPDGRALLHGDFHPGNILTSGSRRYIIDWFGAASGHALADVAHTWLLCAEKPRIPGENALLHGFLKRLAKSFGEAYLKAMRSEHRVDSAEFGLWLAVRAAERAVYGQLSERDARARFVKACRKLQADGVPPEQWRDAL